MVKKDFLLNMGERTTAPTGTDELYQSKVNERKRKEIERQEEKDEAKHEADMAEYRKKKVGADSAADKTGGTKKEESTGFKVTGGIDVGNINLMEERQVAREEVERLRKESRADVERTAQENNQLRSDLHSAEMKAMEANTAAQLELIRSTMDTRSPIEVMKDIRVMAAELGLQAPDPEAKEPTLEVKLLELKHSEAQRDREFQWKMKQDEWLREDKKEERIETRNYNMAKLAQDKENSDFWKTLPSSIGQAFGEGIAASPEGATPAVRSKKKTQKQRGELEVPVGAGGKTQCPACGTEVAIGPTARIAVCANCETEISIKRTKDSPGPISGGEQDNGPEEDEE